MKRQSAAAIRVAVAAPFPDIVRIHEGAAEYADELEVCAMISDADAVLAQAARLRPDVLLLSEELGPTRLDTLARLSTLAPATRLLMLVADVDAAAGPIADGVIRLDAPPDQLHAAIRAAVGRPTTNRAPAAHARPAPSAPGAPSQAGTPARLRVASSPEPAPSATVSAPGSLDATPDASVVFPVGEPVAAAGPRPGRTVVVFSGKGGVGTSVVATNLATVLARRGARVALVDLDLQFGDVGMLLHIDGHAMTIDELAQRGDRLDGAVVEDALATSVDGVRVLLAPRSPEASDLVTPASVAEVLSLLSRTHDHVVVDSPGQLEERIVGVMEAADEVLLLSSFSLAAVKDTKVTLRLLQSLGFEPGRVSVVLNRIHPTAAFTAEHIGRTLQFSILGTLPYESRMDQAVDRGRPLVVIEPRCGFTKELERLADHVARHEARSGSSASRHRARWRLRFGR